MESNLILILICFVSLLRFSHAGQEKSLESVPDLEKLMYTSLDGYPCVRLLNLTAEIGCSNPGRRKVVAPVVRFSSVDNLAESSALLISLSDFESLFARLSRDSNYAKHVAGVLVESGNGTQVKAYSPDKQFPQSEFAPYGNQAYAWNPSGSGVMWRAYNFPIFLLSDGATLALGQVATKNENEKKSYTMDVAEFDLEMQTTKSGTHDSESCLREGTCLPLGGYSVLSALPPFNISSSQKSKPIILAVTSMDSASFFRDKSLGADSPISGLISLLAAVDALAGLSGLDDFPKQLVFVVFTGESWGYLGSRRFVFELDQHGGGIDGLDLSMLEMVLEIGSVGSSSNHGVKTFFAHATDAMSTSNKTLNALKYAQDSLKNDNVKIAMANTANPGIPPSSLMTFLNKKPQTSGVLLSDFDTSFTNSFYHSHLDDLNNINSSAIVAAASLVARTLYILSSGKSDFNASGLTGININASLVDELVDCLLNCEPGLQCNLVKRYISPLTTCPSHYVGVVLGEPSFDPYPGYVLDVPRFLWNFLADKTSRPAKDISSTCPKGCNGPDQVCIRLEIDGKSACVSSSTRYIPAYSPRLKYESDMWKLLPYNSSDSMGQVDPVWTESNWNTIGLRVYTSQGATYDRLILGLGIAVTLTAYLVIAITRKFIAKALKRD